MFHADFNSSRPTGFNVVEICPNTNCFLDRVKLSGEIILPSILYWMRIYCKPNVLETYIKQKLYRCYNSHLRYKLISVRRTVFMYVWICCSSIVLWSSQPFIWIKRSPDTVKLKHGRYAQCMDMMYVIYIHVCLYACVCGSNSWPRNVSLGWPLQLNWI